MIETICKNIEYVGCIDWNVRDFHGYETRSGSTYNAYLIRDEKVAVIDTVKESFADQFIGNISESVSLDKIDYIICNHAEPDHAGALPALVNVSPNAKVVCNAKCKAALENTFDVTGWKFEVIENGGSLSLGEYSLVFKNTPMAHWPESMVTYVPECKLLFSMDAFGQHYASSGRFDDALPLEQILSEAKTYYANILMPFGRSVRNAIKVLSDLEIDIIAPSHGVIWREHVSAIIEAYQEWLSGTIKPKVLVIYDTMWKSTEQMAFAIMEGAAKYDVETHLLHARKTHATKIVAEVLDAAAIAVGSPTLNNTIMPQLAAVLTYMKGLKPRNKVGFAFGSYGWSQGGTLGVIDYLEEMKFELLCDPIRSCYSPDDKVIEECKKAGALLAEQALKFKN